MKRNIPDADGATIKLKLLHHVADFLDFLLVVQAECFDLIK